MPSSNLLLSSFTFNVALVLDRANDPTALLNADWASRQQQLEALTDSGTLWSTYGASPASYAAALTALGPGGLNVPTVDQVGANGYVSSVESRTIWVQVNETNFTTLFGGTAVLRDGGTDAFGNPIVFWQGNLSLPDSLINAGVSGLWFDNGSLSTPILAHPAPILIGAGLALGPQSQGNSGPVVGEYPSAIAAAYNFPFSSPALWTSVPTGRIGLVEPGIGIAPNTAQGFDSLLNAYRNAAGITAPAQPTIDVAPGGQTFIDTPERSLDIGIVTTVNPQTQLVLYAGSGNASNARSDAFTAYQAAFWDTASNPEVVSSSFKSFPRVAPGSPFAAAIQELFVDAALRNITLLLSAGDGGSGDQYANGLTNIAATHDSPFGLVVGGASFSTVQSASLDETLNGASAAFADIFAAAMAGDPATVWQLVAGGLKALPSAAAADDKLLETAWNACVVAVDSLNADRDFMSPGYMNDFAGSGGVDPTQPQPWYQTAFGLDLRTADPAALPGRGVPDVSAASGGNMFYLVPGSTMAGTELVAGTSAAAPL